AVAVEGEDGAFGDEGVGGHEAAAPVVAEDDVGGAGGMFDAKERGRCGGGEGSRWRRCGAAAGGHEEEDSGEQGGSSCWHSAGTGLPPDRFPASRRQVVRARDVGRSQSLSLSRFGR